MKLPKNIDKIKDSLLARLPQERPEFFKRLKPNQLYTAGMVTAGILIMLYLVIFIRPNAVRLVRFFRETRTIRAETVRLESELANFDRINKSLTEENSRLDLIKTQLAREGEIEPILDYLSSIAKSSYVKIIAISPQQEIFEENKRTLNPDDIFAEFPVAINAQCGYHQLGLFVSRLELSEPMIRIDNISIEADTRNPTKHKVNLVVMSAVNANKRE